MEYKVFGEKKDNIEYIDRQAVYALISDAEGRIAVVEAENPYYLGLPGGGLEANESHDECLLREGLEELGWEIRSVEYVGEATEYFFSPKYQQYQKGTGYFYLAEYSETDKPPIEEDMKLRWITKEDAINGFFHNHQKYALDFLPEVGKEKRDV